VGGSKSNIAREGWQETIQSPSDIPYPGRNPPQALDEAAIKRTIAAFTDAATRADRIGFDAIEIHGAHGYLIHKFLSPSVNNRTDKYGGSLQGRMRFTIEVYEAIRAVSSSPPFGGRQSAKLPSKVHAWKMYGVPLGHRTRFRRTTSFTV
jgi:2,4-dienoyl-CoA reductase-like NADH-dependent reductase (Old Yellow Enzyme family)